MEEFFLLCIILDKEKEEALNTIEPKILYSLRLASNVRAPPRRPFLQATDATFLD